MAKSDATSYLERDKVDQAFLETEAWADLVFRTFRAASETRDRAKVQLLARILIGASRVDRDTELEAEAVLASVADLSPLELEVASAIWRMLTRDGADDRDLQLAEANERWSEEALPRAARPNRTFHLKRIERAGLISEYAGAYLDYGGGAYQCTATFRRLMRELEKNRR